VIGVVESKADASYPTTLRLLQLRLCAVRGGFKHLLPTVRTALVLSVASEQQAAGFQYVVSRAQLARLGAAGKYADKRLSA